MSIDCTPFRGGLSGVDRDLVCALVVSVGTFMSLPSSPAPIAKYGKAGTKLADAACTCGLDEDDVMIAGQRLSKDLALHQLHEWIV